MITLIRCHQIYLHCKDWDHVSRIRICLFVINTIILLLWIHNTSQASPPPFDTFFKVLRAIFTVFVLKFSSVLCNKIMLTSVSLWLTYLLQTLSNLSLTVWTDFSFLGIVFLQQHSWFVFPQKLKYLLTRWFLTWDRSQLSDGVILNTT